MFAIVVVAVAVNDYFITGLLHHTITSPYAFFFSCLNVIVRRSAFNVRLAYTSFSENDHITLNLNMIRVDYRLMCAQQEVGELRSVTIYCCIPFSILSPSTTTLTPSLPLFLAIDEKK